MPARLCAVLPGARCLGADGARLAVQRRTPPHLHASHAAPVARSHLFVPKCVAHSCEFTAKMLPQFATGRGTYIVPTGEVAGTRGLFPSETTCDEASINHPHFNLELPPDGNGDDRTVIGNAREYGGLKSMTIASGTHCHVACKHDALSDGKSAYVPADVSCNAGVLTMGECEPAFCYLLDRDCGGTEDDCDGLPDLSRRLQEAEGSAPSKTVSGPVAAFVRRQQSRLAEKAAPRRQLTAKPLSAPAYEKDLEKYGVPFCRGGCKIAGETADGKVPQLDAEKLAVDIQDGGSLLVGLNIGALAIPVDSPIGSAHLTFSALEGGSPDGKPVRVTIRAEAADDAADFVYSEEPDPGGRRLEDDPAFPHDLSKRPLTKASVSWTVPTDVEAGEDISSPDLSKIVEEVVGRNGWKEDNSIVFIFEIEDASPLSIYDYFSPAAGWGGKVNFGDAPGTFALSDGGTMLPVPPANPDLFGEDLDPRAPTWGTCRPGFSPSVGFAWQPGLKGFFPADAGFGDADIYQAMDDVFGYPQSEMTLRHGGTCELQCPYGSEPVYADGKKDVVDDGEKGVVVVEAAMAEVPLTTAPPRRHPPRTRRRPSHPLRTALTAPPLSCIRAGDVRPRRARDQEERREGLRARPLPAQRLLGRQGRERDRVAPREHRDRCDGAPGGHDWRTHRGERLCVRGV